MIEGQNALNLLQLCALHKFHMTVDQNTRDQITRVQTRMTKFRSVHSIHS